MQPIKKHKAIKNIKPFSINAIHPAPCFPKTKHIAIIINNVKIIVLNPFLKKMGYFNVICV